MSRQMAVIGMSWTVFANGVSTIAPTRSTTMKTRAGGPGDDQPAVTAAAERHEIVALDEHVEPDPVAVELLDGPEVGSGQHHVNCMLYQHACSSPAGVLFADLLGAPGW
jgi:hypothetical protein